MLHPRVLDVLEVLIGPDVLAMLTMLFLKPPGKPGQGWHQDSYYIPTHPDSLCGAWIAIDDCDERNGAMWFAAGSQTEPVYPPQSGYGYGDAKLATSRTSTTFPIPTTKSTIWRALPINTRSFWCPRKKAMWYFSAVTFASLERQLDNRPVSSRLCQPLLQRAQLHAVGRQSRYSQKRRRSG